MKRRTVWLALIVLAIALLAVGCAAPAAAPAAESSSGGEAAAPAEEAAPAAESAAESGAEGEFMVPDDLKGGEIIVYSPFPDEEIQALAAPFTEMSDIKVSNIVISTGESLSRLKAEAANPQADFWLSVRAAVVQDALNNDPPLVMEYKPSTVDQISPVYQYPDSTFFTGVGMYPLVFFYNKSVLEEDGLDVPETYDDLLDPQYEGKIVMPHPATSGTAYSAITSFLQIYGEEEGWTYIENLAKNVDQFTRSGRAPHRLVAQGEYPIGIGFYDAVYNLNQEGFELIPVFPSPIFADPYTAAVVAGAPNEAKAKLFYDYLLTPPAQAVLTEYGNYSVREDVDPPADAKPLSELDVLDYDWAKWGDEKAEVLDKFIEITQIQPPEKK